MLGLTFSSELDCGSCIVYITKTASKKIGVLIHSRKFLSPEVALFLNKSTIQQCVEYCCQYCCHGWCSKLLLGLLDKLQKQLCQAVGASLLPLMNPWLIVRM